VADAQLAARALFPRGLVQPERGFRFSVDALLLADFTDLRGVDRVADLGCGCGVVGLALLLRGMREPLPDGALPRAPLRVVGLDNNPEMVACANENAARLGLGAHCRALPVDVAAVRGHPELAPESVDLVVCNPPYREPGTGRRCPDPGRDAARFTAGAATADFTRAAAYLLGNRRRACFIGLAERLDALLADLAAARLMPKRLRLVHPRAGAPARLVLAEAMKNGGPGLTVEPPLFLE
jgi:tRNA1Val (adenine37-N6)-methyltransferase